MNETFLHLLYFLGYLTLFIVATWQMLKVGLRELREARQKLSLGETFQRAGIFSTFVFSLTGILGTCLSLIYRIITVSEILSWAFTAGFITSLLVIIIRYVYQLILKKFGEPL